MIDILELSEACAPELPVALVISISEQESQNNPFAIGHPSVSPSQQPVSYDEALLIANKLSKEGQRYDAGLMQISSVNFNWLNLNNENVFDPCTNLEAAQRVIKEGLNIEGKNIESVFNSISRYNSGNAKTGYSNGYVEGVAVNLLRHSSNTEINTDTTSNPETTKWSEIGNTVGLFSSSDTRTNNDMFAKTKNTEELSVIDIGTENTDSMDSDIN